LRLDTTDIRKWKTTVYQLRNAPAPAVAQSITTWLSQQYQIEMSTSGLLSPFEQIEREVVVVAEPVTNILIVSATSRFYNEVLKLIEQLDQRPPMVMIDVLMAQITLTEDDEFGVQLGLQDSVLFNRSSPITSTTSGAGLAPGFAFNNQPLGNSTSGVNSNPALVGTQGLSDLGLSRQNSNLGFGGLVLSASSESVSVLLRALKQQGRVDILSRPTIMTLHNQPAYVQVGQVVPVVTTVSQTTAGTTSGTVSKNTGLVMQVIPRISPDGLVVMDIDVSNSTLLPISQGIPIFVSNTGNAVNSPIFDQTLAQTTVSALSGQTVVLGGMLQKNKTTTTNSVPVLGDVPVLGRLFRYDSTTLQKTELLIVMTPRIVKNEADAERIKRIDASRMNWCIGDVTELYGEAGLRTRCDNWTDAETAVVYPDAKPNLPGSLPGAEPVAAPQPLGQAPAGAVPPAAVPQRPSPALPSTAPAGPSGDPSRSYPDPSASQPRPPSGPQQAVFEDQGSMSTRVTYGPPPNSVPGFARIASPPPQASAQTMPDAANPSR
jgi:type II secretory pathway component GspD/PulD (secretin)